MGSVYSIVVHEKLAIEIDLAPATKGFVFKYNIQIQTDSEPTRQKIVNKKCTKFYYF
jgi:hypothetical protein